MVETVVMAVPVGQVRLLLLAVPVQRVQLAVPVELLLVEG